MFVQELKKLFVKNKGIYIVIILILLKILFPTFNSNSAYIEQNIELNKTIYSEYCEKFGGKLNLIKIRKIDEYITNIKSAESKSNIILEKYYNNLINNNEYCIEIAKLKPLLNQKKIIQYFDDYYQYCKEDTSNRYLVYENSWVVLLTDSGLDVFLVLLIILLVTGIYTNEYNVNMNLINNTTKKGKTSLFNVKLLIGVVASITIVILFSIINFIVVDNKYGLNGLSYPIQSVQKFQNITYEISLFGMFLLQMLIKIFGAIIITVIISAISIIFKTKLESVCTALLLIIVPSFLFETITLSDHYYFSTLFTPAVYRGGIFNNLENCLYEMNTKKMLIGFFVLSLFTLILYYIAKSIYHNKNILTKIYKSIYTCLLFVIFANITGCETTEVSKTKIDSGCIVDYNGVLFNLSQTDVFYVDDCKSVFNNVFENNVFRTKFKIVENKIYYLEQTDLLSLRYLNLDNFKEYGVYPKINDENEMFFTKNQIDINKNFFFNDYFVLDDFLILTGENNRIFNLKNDEISLFAENSDGAIYSLFKKDNQIFFINDMYELRFFDITNKSYGKIDDIYVKQALCYNNSIYCTQIDENKINLCFIDDQFNLKTIIKNENITDFIINEEKIIYVIDNSKVYISDLDGNGKQFVYEGEVFGIGYINNTVYITDFAGKILMSRKNTWQKPLSIILYLRTLIRRLTMEKILRQSLLYDFYGELLTEHQKSVFEDYVLNNIGLSEIALDRGISRQGVYDLIKRCDGILENYESKLKLIDKFLKTKDMVRQIHTITKQFDNLEVSLEQKKLVDEINDLSNSILEEL